LKLSLIVNCEEEEEGEVPGGVTTLPTSKEQHVEPPSILLSGTMYCDVTVTSAI
jgi:hypothetical protein